jgi:hypothetical protein
MCRVFGGAIVFPAGLTWLDYFGLWLNIGREHRAQVMAAAQGAEIGAGVGKVPWEHFDAISAFPEEAAPISLESNADRLMARMQRRG